MIIVSGYNVFPREVEEVLHRNPNIEETAVVGKTDDYRGELPIAFIVVKEGHLIDEEELKQYCTNHLAPYKIPVEFRIIDALPKTVVGKVDKILLSAMANSPVSC